MGNEAAESRPRRVVVVVPTYNERENLARLLPRILQVTANEKFSCHVLVVDDNSPDGSSAVVEGLRERGFPLSLLAGSRRGLGAAYARGLAYALDRLAPDIVVQMDADFSHAPEDLPRLISALDDDVALVIGSRYLEGDRASFGWRLFRRLLSRTGNLVSRHWLGMAGIHDCTAGFRAWRADALAALLKDTIDVSGYGFQVALLQRAVRNGRRVREVKVDFPPRQQGKSKLRWIDLLEFGYWVLRQRNFAASGAVR